MAKKKAKVVELPKKKSNQFEIMLEILSEGHDGESLEQRKRREKRCLEMTATLEAYNQLVVHITNGLRNNTLVCTGDTTHSTIEKYLIDLKRCNDKKKYDFQSDDVYMQDALRIVESFFDGTMSMFNFEKAIRAGLKIEDLISGKEEFLCQGRDSYMQECNDCCETVNLFVRGNCIDFRVASGKCETNRGFSVEIDFPTGEVVFGDFPGRLVEADDAKLFERHPNGANVNSMKGKRLVSESMASSNILHMFVSNTSPGLHFNAKTNQIHIGRTLIYNYNEKTKVETEKRNPQIKGYIKLGYFITDLWWVTMLDKSVYDALIAQVPVPAVKKWRDREVEIVKITPGRYRFTSHFGLDTSLDHEDYADTFVTAEYLGPC